MYIPRKFKIVIVLIIIAGVFRFTAVEAVKYYNRHQFSSQMRYETNYTKEEGEFEFDNIFKVQLPAGHGVTDNVDEWGYRTVFINLGSYDSPVLPDILITTSDGKRPVYEDDGFRATDAIALGKDVYLLETRVGAVGSNIYRPTVYKFVHQKISISCSDFNHPKVKYVFDHWEWLEGSEPKKDN